MAAMARGSVGSRAATESGFDAASRLGAFADYFLHFPLQLFKRSIQRTAPRVDDNLPVWADLGQPNAKGFTNPTPDPVPDNRLAKCSRYCKSDTRQRAGLSPNRFRLQAERNEQWTWKSNPVIVDPAVLTGLENAGLFGERKLNGKPGRLSRR